IWHLYHLEIRDTHSSGTKLRGRPRISCTTSSIYLRRYLEGQLTGCTDFAGLTEGMRQTLAGKLRMVYTGDDGQMSNTKMGLDVVDTLCFQLGGARRKMTWRKFPSDASAMVRPSSSS
ncbi:hypothetical protein Tco_1490218, partial [Tanacetum coccineum]